MKKILNILAMLITASLLLNTMCIPASAAVCVDNGHIIDGGFYRIQAITTNKYITVSNNSTKNGADLILSDLSLDDNSNVFRFHHISDSTYKIEAYCSKKMIEVESSSKKDRAIVQQWSDKNKENREWIVQMSDGYFAFKNKNSGLYMNIENNSTNSGTPIIQYHWDNTSASKFILISLNTEDVKSAFFTSYGDNVQYKSSYYSDRGDCLVNNTRFGDIFNIPEEGQKILSNSYYLSHDDLHRVLLEGNLKKNESLLEKIGKFSFNEFQDYAYDELLGKFSIVPKLILTILPQNDYSDYNHVMRIISRVSQEESYKGLVIKTYICFEEGLDANGHPSINEKCAEIVVDYWYPGYSSSLQREESNGEWLFTFGYLE